VSAAGSIEAILYQAAACLGPLRQRVVFVGGAVRGLLITDPAVEGPRPTKDIDVIAEVTPRSACYRLEEELRGLGFRNERGCIASVSPDLARPPCGAACR
jgi:hypothetical protein